MFIETERLLLRPLLPSDFQEVCLLLQDPEVMYAYEGAFTTEEVHLWMNRQFERYQKDGYGLLGMIEKGSGCLIGQSGLTKQPYKEISVTEIGYLLRKEFWHRGYATEAAIACKQYAFDTLQQKTVYSIIRNTNMPSQQVARRNGMLPIDTIQKFYRNVSMPHIVFAVDALSSGNTGNVTNKHSGNFLSKNSFK